MIGRPNQIQHRISVLRRRKRQRGWLPLEERIELRYLERQQRANERKRERYHNDREFRDHTRSRILAWQRARREERA